MAEFVVPRSIPIVFATFIPPDGKGAPRTKPGSNPIQVLNVLLQRSVSSALA
jgi:hypothetical protein